MTVNICKFYFVRVHYNKEVEVIRFMELYKLSSSLEDWVILTQDYSYGQITTP